MSDYASQFYSAPQTQYVDSKAELVDDLFSFETADYNSLKPFHSSHIDDFDSEIDSLVDPAFEFAFNLPDNSEVFTHLRSETPTRGAPSTITTTSASESFSYYADSLSSYNPALSPASQNSLQGFWTCFLDFSLCKVQTSALIQVCLAMRNRLTVTLDKDQQGQAPTKPRDNEPRRCQLCHVKGISVDGSV